MTGKLTPMMRQYHRIKKEHSDAILLYHMGDFYEMFYQDAEDASRILSIALTTRDRHKSGGIPLCGFPCHAAESYINRLLKQGRKVAICDQVEDPSTAKGLVKREVTRVITPGTVLDDSMLEDKSNNFIVAVNPGGTLIGVAAADLSTGEFFFLEIPSSRPLEFEDRLFYFSPAEIILPEGRGQELVPIIERAALPASAPTYVQEAKYDPLIAHETLLEHFQVHSLDIFGCGETEAGTTAAGALLAYIQETQRRPLVNIVTLRALTAKDAMALDSSTQRNLELVANLEDGRRAGSLWSVLDYTVTSMGGRKLRSWILTPLMNSSAVGRRLFSVEELIDKGEARQRLRSLLGNVLDLQRLGSRISLNTCTPRDLGSLRNSLHQLPGLKEEMKAFDSDLLLSLADFDTLPEVKERLDDRLVDDPPLKLKDGGLIREGYHPELDELRRTVRDSRSWLSRYEEEERTRTGINSLKVGFNRIHGYFIEVTKAHLKEVPDDYSRRQTLVNAERFHSEKLREFETRVLGAEEKITALEVFLFEELRLSLAAEAGRLQTTGDTVAVLDVLQSLAEAAVVKNYSRPEVDEGLSMHIVEGRHPVVELSGDERFVPNDIDLDSAGCQIMIITGPNMAGKSTYLRQTALIALMAQIGSFVPAREARIGLVDRIFTRIGAADKLSRGQSTFMVEMVETASILHNATPRSLIILDEVGRGTSTFDGLSIAWAIVEHLHGGGEKGPKTLFATHYHHLTELPATLERAKNFNIAVREWEGKIFFLRKIVEGGTDKSYGIHVAKLAGLPAAVVDRAREILMNLEQGEYNLEGAPQLARRDSLSPLPAPAQMTFFPTAGEEIIKELHLLDLEATTPLEAFRFLIKLKENIEKKPE